jgi:hypothetical protein
MAFLKTALLACCTPLAFSLHTSRQTDADMIKEHASPPLDRLDGAWRRRGFIRAPSPRQLSRLLLLLGCISFVHFLNLHIQYREALAAKYLPTEFLDFEDGHSNATQRLYSYVHGGASDAARAGIVSERSRWTRLGAGREGEAFVYGNSVVKVYNERSSPFRNCVPTEGTTLRWPTEIAATLIMGGSSRNMTDGLGTSPQEAFLPVDDFFHTPTKPGAAPQWHLVTPFLRAGTLKKLAATTSASGTSALSFRDVDALYRPSFEHLLGGLDLLHNKHNLCHDDIKADNIFVASPERPTHWVLADLGNARQPSHPYHSSILWTADTHQNSDCKLNDVIRLVKVYMAFVRAASSDPANFDDAFFAAAEPLPAMYWDILRNPAPAIQVRETSSRKSPSRDGASAPVQGSEVRAGTAVSLASFFMGRRRAMAIAVSRHLRVGASETKGRLFGLSWLMGIPVLGCQAAAA